MTKITDEKIDEFVNRILEETCENKIPKLILSIFEGIRNKYPNKWRHYIYSSISKINHEI